MPSKTAANGLENKKGYMDTPSSPNDEILTAKQGGIAIPPFDRLYLYVDKITAACFCFWLGIAYHQVAGMLRIDTPALVTAAALSGIVILLTVRSVIVIRRKLKALYGSLK